MTVQRLLAAAAILATSATMAIPDEAAIGARQGQFKLFAHNLGVLGGMAQGRVDYDADAAQTAADNLFHLTRHDQARLWPEGSDSMSVDGTRAMPQIWDDFDDFVAKFVALQTAAVNTQSVAGDGLDALRGAVGPMAATCGACHDSYREPQ